jgi:DNA-binding transcriptional LysR family regulator
MEMHQVRYFLAVARTLNFTQAAEECHVAQPSLSRAIIKLEEELGGALFRRERGLTHMTELGRLMLPQLTRCYESAVSAKTLAASYRKGTCAPLRFALSQTVNLQLLTPALTELVRAFPGLELKFARGTAEEVAENLKSGAAELAMACPLGLAWDRFESWPLFTERFVLVLHESHPLARDPKISIARLGDVRLLRRAYCEHAGAVETVLAAKGVRLQTDDSIASDNDLVALLGANVGASIMPGSTQPAGPLRVIPIEDLELTRPVVLYAVAGRQRSPAAAGLLRLLRGADWSRYQA